MDDKWFKQQQKRAGVTAEHIAERLGKDRSLVSRIYVGRQKMSLEQAEVFADVLGVPVATIMEKAGIGSSSLHQSISPGFSESEAVPFSSGLGQPENADIRRAALAFGQRAGVDVWRVKGRAMQAGGYLEGDFILVDTHAADSARAGDIVIAQVYSPKGAATVLRHFEPPVLVASSPEPGDARVHVVDGVNVVIRGKVIASWRAG